MTQRKLLDQVSDIARFRHLSLRTEETYRNWIKRYILFHRKRHPAEMGAGETEQFLNHLAVDKRVRGLNPKPGIERPDLSLSRSASAGP